MTDSISKFDRAAKSLKKQTTLVKGRAAMLNNEVPLMEKMFGKDDQGM